MKTNVSDTRRTHTLVRYHNGERTEDLVTGDVRIVTVTFGLGEVDDIMSMGTDRAIPSLLRPQHVELRWQRGTHWAFGRWGNQAWNYGPDCRTEDWVLDVARIEGPNVRKDGSLGKERRAALHRNERHTRAPLDKMPEWFVKLIAEHDPAIHGSPLDDEPVV